MLRQIQNDLFDAGADLSTPPVVENPKYPPLRVTQSYIDRLEDGAMNSMSNWHR